MSGKSGIEHGVPLLHGLKRAESIVFPTAEDRVKMLIAEAVAAIEPIPTPSTNHPGKQSSKGESLFVLQKATGWAAPKNSRSFETTSKTKQRGNANTKTRRRLLPPGPFVSAPNAGLVRKEWILGHPDTLSALEMTPWSSTGSSRAA